MNTKGYAATANVESTSDYLRDRMIAREGKISEIKALQHEQAEIERDVKEVLIQKGWVDFLDVNWARLRRVAR